MAVPTWMALAPANSISTASCQVEMPPSPTMGIFTFWATCHCETARLFNGTAVDMVELNISCPNVKAGGLAYGTKPEMAAEVTEIAKRHATVPIMASTPGF